MRVPGPVLAVIRFVYPRRAQEIEQAEKAKATAPAAYQNAREVAEAAGPWRMAHDLELDAGAGLEAIAEAAAADYHVEVRPEAKRGSRDGFDRFLAGEVE